MERLTSMRRVGGALDAIGNAVIGVIASLGLDYGLAVVFPETRQMGLDVTALLLIVVSFLALRRKVSLGVVLAAGTFMGLLKHVAS